MKSTHETWSFKAHVIPFLAKSPSMLLRELEEDQLSSIGIVKYGVYTNFSYFA